MFNWSWWPIKITTHIKSNGIISKINNTITVSMKSSEILYKPSLVAKIAAILLPTFQKILPAPFYRAVYNFSYKSYKSALNKTYLFFVFNAKISGDPKKIKKAQLVNLLLPFTMGGRMALENAFDVISIIEAKQIPGDIVECGVAEGGTAAMMALASSFFRDGAPRKKWFFDSYEGLPEPTPEDYENGRAGHFIRPLPKGSCLGTIEQVEKLLFDNLRIPRDEITLIKGWFQDTAPIYKNVISQIAVLRLDGDWYESTKIPLDNFFPNVSSGGIVIIDDYATCFGSRRAVDEYMEINNLNLPLIPDGRGGAWFQKS
jgi:hypothetical protein